MSRAHKLAYIAEFDGLRGVAILAVLLIHLRAAFFPQIGGFHGGVLGVDLFFVLSGFLITSLLLEERIRTGSIRLKHFYARRVLRLLPAMLLALALGGIVVWAVGANASDKPYWLVAILAATVSNWFVPGLGILDHTWSLGLEEQYYVSWSFTLRFALRSVRPLRVAGVLGGLAVAVAVARWWGVRQSPTPWFITPLGRVDGILVGSALALVFRSRLEATARRVLADGRVLAAALVGVVVSAWLARDSSLRSVYDACSVAVPCFVVLVGHAALGAESTVNRVLRWSSLRHVGRISYGLYLYHLPVFVLVAFFLPGHALVRCAAGIVAACLVSAASFRWLETPVLGLKVRWGTPVGIPTS